MTANGNVKCISLLLQHNADINKPNAYGYTPLQLLTNNHEWFQILKSLIDANIDTTAWLRK